jgi:hypothetical protein
MKQRIGQFMVETERARVRRDWFVAWVWHGPWLYQMFMGPSESAVFDGAYGYCRTRPDERSAD